MAEARILTLCDAAVDLILAGWRTWDVAPGANDDVMRGYAPQISFTPDSPPQIVGRQVFVFPWPYTATTFTRSSQWRGYLFKVLVAEQYEPDIDAGDEVLVPDSWVDERVRFCEQVIFNPLVNPALSEPENRLAGAFFPPLEEEAVVEVLYDGNYLQKNKAFWSVMTFPFVEETDWTGGTL